MLRLLLWHHAILAAGTDDHGGAAEVHTGVGSERKHRTEPHRGAHQPRMPQEQTGRDVGAVGKSNRDDAVALEPIRGARTLNECRKVVGPLGDIFLIDHSFGESSEEARRTVLEHLPPGTQ